MPVWLVGGKQLTVYCNCSLLTVPSTVPVGSSKQSPVLPRCSCPLAQWNCTVGSEGACCVLMPLGLLSLEKQEKWKYSVALCCLLLLQGCVHGHKVRFVVLECLLTENRGTETLCFGWGERVGKY